MTKSYQYFSIPFASLSTLQPPPSTVWFAAWSSNPPAVEPGMPPPFVMCATEYEPPEGAVALGTGSKDPPPPPPALSTTSMPDYQRSFTQWLEQSRDADE